MNYITIEEISGEQDNKVHQALRFKTGNFIWRVKFNLPLNPKTVNSQTCYVTKANGDRLNTSIQYNASNHTIEIAPLEPYGREGSYHLHITTAVASKKGQQLKQNISIRFKL